MRTPRFVSALLLASFCSTGCYSSTAVKPTELPKLNGSFAQPVGQQGSQTIVAVSVAKVERPDGRLLEVVGKHDVSLQLNSGEQLSFDSPVLAEAEQDSLVIAGSNRAKTKLKWADIARADVSQYDGTKTFLVVLGISCIPAVIAGIALGVAVASRPKPTP